MSSIDRILLFNVMNICIYRERYWVSRCFAVYSLLVIDYFRMSPLLRVESGIQRVSLSRTADNIDVMPIEN